MEIQDEEFKPANKTTESNWLGYAFVTMLAFATYNEILADVLEK